MPITRRDSNDSRYMHALEDKNVNASSNSKQTAPRGKDGNNSIVEESFEIIDNDGNISDSEETHPLPMRRTSKSGSFVKDHKSTLRSFFKKTTPINTIEQSSCSEVFDDRDSTSPNLSSQKTTSKGKITHQDEISDFADLERPLNIEGNFLTTGMTISSGVRVTDTNIAGSGRDSEEDGDGFESNNSTKDSLLDDEHEYPEKGLLIIIGGWLCLFSVFGLYFIAGTIQSYLQTHQLKNETPTTISWIFAIYYCIFLSATVLSGLYFDINGFRAPAIVGTVMYGIGIMVLGNCSKVWHFIICFGLLIGVGSAILTAPILGVVTHYFYKKRSFANALVINGGSFAGVILPLMLNKLFKSVGYAWSMRIMGFICISCLLVGVFLVKERKEFRLIKPDNIKTWKFYLKESFDYKSLYQDWKFIFCTFAISLCELGSGLTLIYLSSYCVSVGHYSENNSFLIITVLNLMSIVGGYLNGYLADKFGTFNIMIIIQLVLPLANLILWYNFGNKSMKVLYGYAVIYGLEFGGLICLAPSCCAQIAKNDFGKKYSTMYFIVGVFFLAGIPIAGEIIGDSSKKNYDNFIIYCSMMLFVSAICFILSKMFAIVSYIKSDSPLSYKKLMRDVVCKRF